jgi:hypothetical protein
MKKYALLNNIFDRIYFFKNICNIF